MLSFFKAPLTSNEVVQVYVKAFVLKGLTKSQFTDPKSMQLNLKSFMKVSKLEFFLAYFSTPSMVFPRFKITCLSYFQN